MKNKNHKNNNNKQKMEERENETMARLISPTTAIKEQQSLLLYIARISNPVESERLGSEERDKSLIRYCIKNQHWSVFESSYMTIEITTSRMITSQILRHRSFTFQEFSQRYSEIPEDDVIKMSKIRKQSEKNRQGSGLQVGEDEEKIFKELQDKVWETCYGSYKIAISKGVAREQARGLLPLMTKTKICVTGNVRSWIHYLTLRLDTTTQEEHRDVAKCVYRIFNNVYPDIAHEAKIFYNWNIL